MEKKKNLKICGIEVPFPYEKPYPAQTAIMANTINAMRRGVNAVLESPTGTGKSVSLLAASLAFQKDLKMKIKNDPEGSLDINPTPSRNYLGFFPPTSHQIPGAPMFNPILTEDLNPDEVSRYGGEIEHPIEELEYAVDFPVKKRHAKQIWYSTRTHQQLKQLVSELKTIPYHPQMCILAARSQVCVNRRVASSGNVDEECTLLTKNGGCPYNKNFSIPAEFKPHGVHEKFELEELKEYCRRNKYCPYIVSRKMMKEADIVFCPYNYFLDPRIKGQMMLDLTGSFIIIDEAHNIESTCRENGSFHHTRSTLDWCLMYIRKELKYLKPSEKRNAFLIVLDFLSKEFNWFNMITNVLRNQDNNEYVASNITDVFNIWSLNEVTYIKILAAFDCIFKYGNSTNTPDELEKGEENKIAMRLMGELEQLWILIAITFKENNKFRNDYSLAVTIDREDRDNDTLHAICLNPGVVFRRPAEEAHCVVLASGTMSPLDTFAKELMQSFPIKISAPHVISPEQVAGFTIARGINGNILNSSYGTLVRGGQRENVNKSIGEILIHLLPKIPNGVLFFASSHYFLESMMNTWRTYNMLDTINNIKPIFQERPEADPNFFENYKEQALTEQGALLLGVFRGRSSEGIDFINEQARCVIAFGIPFPSYVDLDVKLKKQYNDVNITGGGDEWYEAQAYRALFQALGRCIRTKNDYGSIILIDQRFPNELGRFPRWMKPSIKTNVGINEIAYSLSQFYSSMKVRFPGTLKLQANSPIDFYCADCHRLVFSIKSLYTDQAVKCSAHEELSEFVYSDGSEDFLFIKKNKEDEVDLYSCDRIFIESEKACYEHANCICGKCIGAKVHATTSKKSTQLGGYWILLQRVRVKQGSDLIEAVCPPKKSKVISLGLTSSSQKKFTTNFY